MVDLMDLMVSVRGASSAMDLNEVAKLLEALQQQAYDQRQQLQRQINALQLQAYKASKTTRKVAALGIDFRANAKSPGRGQLPFRQRP